VISEYSDGRLLLPWEACALKAWRVGLEMGMAPDGDEGVLGRLAERDRNILLNHGLGREDETLLHLACRAERPEAEILATVQLLLDKGAHPMVQDARGRTPGDISKERGHASVTAALTLGATALEQIGTVGKSGFRPQVVKAATPAEVDAALASYASARGSWSGPSEPTPPAAASAAARGPKRTGLKLRPGLRMEMQKAAKSGDLHKLKECARKWDAEHPEAQVGFGTDVWVPALWLVAHEAGVAGRVRVLKWLVEDMGVRVHRLLPEEKALIRGSAKATAEPYNTPLASAIYGNQEAAVLYLLRAGAERGDIDVGHHCGEEYTPCSSWPWPRTRALGSLRRLWRRAASTQAQERSRIPRWARQWGWGGWRRWTRYWPTRAGTGGSRAP
jgi:hypothetical protein